MGLPSFTISQATTIKQLIGDIVGTELVSRRRADTKIEFTCSVRPTDLITYDGDIHRVKPVQAYVNVNGAIERDYKPVKLLANDPGLNVEHIQWRVDIYIDGEKIRSFSFEAPEAGVVKDLALEIPDPDQDFQRGRPAWKIVGGTVEDGTLTLLNEDGSTIPGIEIPNGALVLIPNGDSTWDIL